MYPPSAPLRFNVPSLLCLPQISIQKQKTTQNVERHCTLDPALSHSSPHRLTQSPSPTPVSPSPTNNLCLRCISAALLQRNTIELHPTSSHPEPLELCSSTRRHTLSSTTSLKPPCNLRALFVLERSSISDTALHNPASRLLFPCHISVLTPPLDLRLHCLATTM